MTAGITDRCKTKELININFNSQKNNLIANDQISAETRSSRVSRFVATRRCL